MATLADFHGSMYLTLARKYNARVDRVRHLPALADNTNPVWRDGGWNHYSDSDVDHLATNAYHILVAVR